MRTPVLNGLASSTALIALALHLLIHARSELMLDDTDALAAASLTGMDLSIGAS
jgi:hypothetical protein